MVNPKKVPLNIQKEGSIFPYLLVNIGSGVSILRVDSPTAFERVSGTCVGGGTYWGLCRLAVSHDITFEEAFELATKGDPNKVNMTVSDIYGGDYKIFNLPGDVVASSFGKLMGVEHPREQVEPADIARSLLDMIAMNVAQLAYLNAMRCNITRILFAGNFLRQNDISMAMISYSIDYWSGGQIRACFLKHEGYFGSVGAFLFLKKKWKKKMLSSNFLFIFYSFSFFFFFLLPFCIPTAFFGRLAKTAQL
ncbi:hypothetical protein RFI_16165 [Reticulomyxa filosa]|uniref:pantothenate kinase n=1 Tax=Reticulomyxa filosa TaxID=46433 RepID=X6N525_RETFI|nr:hypothetical protein RFI_16165 [Reticulomyxa filosa]|eukprot:ETO21038.1 hypothetical protein RFI_16165 [Reticulomyxa filosa]